jgi:hypothetical protein
MLDCWRAECRVPRMGARQVCNQRQMFERICVIVDHSANFVHICNTIVILGTEGKAFEGVECRDANCVKVPPTET